MTADHSLTSQSPIITLLSAKHKQYQVVIHKQQQMAI